MKTIPFLLFALLIGCASKPDPWVSEAPPEVASSIDPLEPVRYPEVVRQYHIGRTVDSNHGDVMHDSHPVYRVEAQSRWNLKPAGGRPDPLLNPPRDAAYVPPITNDVVLAELNRQKAATERVLFEAHQLAQSFDELQTVLTNMQAVARDHVALKGLILNSDQRMNRMEARMNEFMESVTNRSDEVPPETEADPDSESIIDFKIP